MKKDNRVYGKRPGPSFRKVQQDFSGNRYQEFQNRENWFLEKIDKKIWMSENPNISIGFSESGSIVYTI